jgi:hypothetical protein
MKYFKNRYVTLQIKQEHGTDAKLEERGTSFFAPLVIYEYSSRKPVPELCRTKV